MAKDSEVEKAARPKSLVEQAYEQIKEKIILLHFMPGQ